MPACTNTGGNFSCEDFGDPDGDHTKSVPLGVVLRVEAYCNPPSGACGSCVDNIELGVVGIDHRPTLALEIEEGANPGEYDLTVTTTFFQTQGHSRYLGLFWVEDGIESEIGTYNPPLEPWTIKLQGISPPEGSNPTSILARAIPCGHTGV